MLLKHPFQFHLLSSSIIVSSFDNGPNSISKGVVQEECYIVIGKHSFHLIIYRYLAFWKKNRSTFFSNNQL